MGVRLNVARPIFNKASDPAFATDLVTYLSLWFEL
jgi:hypothetical protein